jgi:hypothetical protein
MSDSLLQYAQVFQNLAEEITAARNKGKVIHTTKNIDAAGDEVEQVVRKILTQQLATAYYVGQGHLVDAELHTSPQFDVIVADKTHMPVLIRTENGTEYFPYESVYAIAEVKTTYRRQDKPIHDFAERTAQLRRSLNRVNVAQTSHVPYLNGSGVFAGKYLEPYGNPLFTFMMFASGESFSIDDVRDLYSDSATAAEDLPNAVCLLDKGCLIYCLSDAERNGAPIQVITVPGLFVPDWADAASWVLVTGDAGREKAYSLAFLLFLLYDHLNRCTLRPPDMLKYLNHVLGGETHITVL